jgi:hypothetical protein
VVYDVGAVTHAPGEEARQWQVPAGACLRELHVRAQAQQQLDGVKLPAVRRPHQRRATDGVRGVDVEVLRLGLELLDLEGVEGGETGLFSTSRT